MKQKILELDGSKYVLNNRGLSKISWFIRECHAKRKEILDATKDTADDTILPTFDDIVSDIEEFWGEDGLEEYCNCWGITDNYDSPALLIEREDLYPVNDDGLVLQQYD